MNMPGLPAEASGAAGGLQRADIVVGVSSQDNAETIAQVVPAVRVGLEKYFPQFTAVIVNADSGSRDGTRDVVAALAAQDAGLLRVAAPHGGRRRFAFPYPGIPANGGAFQVVFQIAAELNAKACAVVDAGLRSITPEWIDLLVRPVLYSGYDFVAPYYHCHKYDGTITTGIVYPMMRALYGKRIRHPTGVDFGLSPALVARCLRRNDWGAEVARYATGIWLTTIAVAERFRVCQCFLGPRLRHGADSGVDLGAALHQAVGGVFSLMEEYENEWKARRSSDEVDFFGFRYELGLDPRPADLNRMWQRFRRSGRELREVWARALEPETLADVMRLAASGGGSERLDDGLWVRLLYEFARSVTQRPMERRFLLRSLAPLYLAWVVSFVRETSEAYAAEVEERIERLCRRFEADKPYLLALWDEESPAPRPPSAENQTIEHGVPPASGGILSSAKTSPDGSSPVPNDP